MTNVQTRIRIEVAVVRSMLSNLKREGFTPRSVYDGEVETKATTADQVLTLALNLDECRVYFNRGGRSAGSVVLVFGNDGWDVISDWGWPENEVGEAFDDALNRFALDNLEERVSIRGACPQPHTWAWLNPAHDTKYGRIEESHGSCIKCGFTTGAGHVADQPTEEVL